MKSSKLFFLTLASIILSGVVLSGCGERSRNLSGDADQLEKSFKLTNSSPTAGDKANFKNAETPALVKTLAAALRTNDMEIAAKALHTLNLRGSGLSFEQYTAIREAFSDVSAELLQRGAKGDSRAQELAQEMSP